MASRVLNTLLDFVEELVLFVLKVCVGRFGGFTYLAGLYALEMLFQPDLVFSRTLDPLFNPPPLFRESSRSLSGFHLDTIGSRSTGWRGHPSQPC